MTSALRERLGWVHSDDSRYGRVRSWHDRAVAASDEFERFFFAYQALVIAARIGTGGNVRNEERAIKDHLDDMRDEVPALVRSTRPQLLWFSGRDLPEGEALLDLSNNEDPVDDRQLFQLLRASVLEHEAASVRRLAKAMATLVIRIRNNLFHGAKDYGSGRDVEVLSNANPIVLGMVELFLRDAPGGL